jgi:hypothetical protein
MNSQDSINPAVSKAKKNHPTSGATAITLKRLRTGRRHFDGGAGA